MPLSRIKANSANLVGTYVQTSGDTITGNLRIGANSNGAVANTSRLMLFDDSNNSDVRYLTSHLPPSSTYNPSTIQSTDKIVSGMRFGWYNTHYSMGSLRGDATDTVGFAIGRSDLGFNNFIVGQSGMYTRSGTADGYQTYYRRWYTFASAFDNPTINLVNVQNGGTNNSAHIRVRVRQIPFSGSAGAFHDEHVGLGSVWTNGSTHSTYVTTMQLTSGLSAGTTNVGTLSWSGSGANTTLRYTANRASNYDSYYVEVEVVQNNGGNFAINMYP